MNQEFYSQDEVQQIVKRAVTVQEAGLVSAHQLAQITAELGITPEALLLAKDQWHIEQSQRARWTNFLRSRKGLNTHLWIYTASNTILGLNIHYSEMNPAFWWISSILDSWRPLPRV